MDDETYLIVTENPHDNNYVACGLIKNVYIDVLYALMSEKCFLMNLKAINHETNIVGYSWAFHQFLNNLLKTIDRK